MPRYVPNQANTTATIPVYPKDSYEMIVRGFKPVVTQKEKDGQQKETVNMSVRLEIKSPTQFAAKPYFYFANDVLNPDGGARYFKLFLMAAYGYNATDEGEAAYNEFVITKDESFDTDSGELGSLYQDAIGKVLVGDLEQTEYNNKPQNRASFRAL